MVIVIPGSTNCGLCLSPINKTDKVVILPSFAANAHDPLHAFSGGVFHCRCLENHLSYADVQERIRLYNAHHASQATCYICGEAVRTNDQQDTIRLGNLTLEQTSPVYPLNLKIFHRKCLADFKQIEELWKFARSNHPQLLHQLEVNDRIVKATPHPGS